MNMTEVEFNNWIIKHKIAPNAANFIRQARDNDPSRRVGGGIGNVTGRYPSRKMGCVIQFESHMVEFPLAEFYENND